jgi:hypothetical protein
MKKTAQTQKPVKKVTPAKIGDNSLRKRDGVSLYRLYRRGSAFSSCTPQIPVEEIFAQQSENDQERKKVVAMLNKKLGVGPMVQIQNNAADITTSIAQKKDDMQNVSNVVEAKSEKAKNSRITKAYANTEDLERLRHAKRRIKAAGRQNVANAISVKKIVGPLEDELKKLVSDTEAAKDTAITPML